MEEIWNTRVDLPGWPGVPDDAPLDEGGLKARMEDIDSARNSSLENSRGLGAVRA